MIALETLEAKKIVRMKNILIIPPSERDDKTLLEIMAYTKVNLKEIYLVFISNKK